ncbi:MAG: hypothetical protein RBR88_06435 [Candidatus Saccharicenans sp.]|nr:hypothetical protein [Candidatus Saccharicenans sp.]
MRRDKSYLFSFYPLILILGLILAAVSSCQNPFSPVDDIDKIPERLIVDGIRITMQPFLYRNLMPGGEPGGSSLIAVITLTAESVSRFPNYLTVDRMYVIYGEEVWETGFEEEIRPLDQLYLNQIQIVARQGPRWPIEGQVDLVIRVLVRDNSTKYIKAVNQMIGAAW